MKNAILAILLILPFGCYSQLHFEDEKILYGTDFLEYSISGALSPVPLISNHDIPDFLGGFNFENGYKISNVTNRIILELSQSQNDLNFDFSVDVPITITYKKRTSNTTNYFKDIVLTVNYNTANGSAFTQKDLYQFEEGYDFDIEIDQTAISYSVPLTAAQKSNIADQLLLKSFLIYAKTIDFEPSVALNWMNIQITGLPIDNSVEVCWDDIEGAVEYDLEWTYAESYDPYLGMLYPYGPWVGLTSSRYDFTNNSARISISSNCYKIPLTYERGLLGFRVRGKGYKGSDQLLIGDWSCSSPSGSCSSYDNISPFSWYSSYAINPAHEGDKLNWQVVTTYAEEGKRKDVINYMDGTMRNRQIVTAINSDENVLVAETIYDHQGRAAIQTLPVPIKGDMVMGYKQNFNQDPLNNPYHKSNFDLDPSTCGQMNTDPMSGVSGSAYYYSQNFYNDLSPLEQQSHHAYIPRSHGYPFIQTSYEADNTGRISRQGGAGPEYQLGSGHETKYFYGTPNQAELDKLFGANVGLANHYKKNMVIDPNGQVSISYLDAKGNTIATALAGESPDGLEQLDSYNPITMQVNLMDFNSKNENDYSLEANYSLLVENEGTYEFNYGVAGEQFQDGCMPIDVCYDCIYDLEIVLVQKACGDTIFRKTETIGTLDFECNGLLTTSFQFDTILQIGAYHLSKSLLVNEAAADAYIDHYLNDTLNVCTNVLDSFLLEELAEIDTMDCMIPCDSIVVDPVNDPELLDWEESACDSLPSSPCAVAKTNMITDLIPGGQYALYDDDFTANGYPLSYLNPLHDIPDMPHYSQIVFADPVDVNGSLIYPQDMTLEQFILNFQESWVETYFLPYHPEFCYLLRCETMEDSHAFDGALTEVNTYAEALALSYVDINDENIIIALQDPYFNNHLSPNEQATFLSSMANFTGPTTGNSIWDVALIMAFCDPPDVVPCTPSPSSLIGSATTEQLDAFWLAYRAFYQTAKSNFEYQLRTVDAINATCYNECIGQQNFNPFINDFADPTAGFPINWGDFDDPEQTCNRQIYNLFSSKQKRFPSMYDALGNMDIDYYNSTNQEIFDHIENSLPSGLPSCDTCSVELLLPELLNYIIDYPKNEAIVQGVPQGFFDFMVAVYQQNIQNNPSAVQQLLQQYPGLGTQSQLQQYHSLYNDILSSTLSIPYSQLSSSFPSITTFLNTMPGDAINIYTSSNGIVEYVFGDRDLGCSININFQPLLAEIGSSSLDAQVLAYTDWNISNLVLNNDNIFTFDLWYYSDYKVTIEGNTNCKFCDEKPCEPLDLASELLSFYNTFNWPFSSNKLPGNTQTIQYTTLESNIGAQLVSNLEQDDTDINVSFTAEINSASLYIHSDNGCGFYLDFNNQFTVNDLMDIQFFQNIVPDYSTLNSNGETRHFFIDAVLTNGSIVTLHGRTNGCFYIGRCCVEREPRHPRGPYSPVEISDRLIQGRTNTDLTRNRRLSNQRIRPRDFPTPIWRPITPTPPFDPLCDDCPSVIVDGGIYDGLDLGEDCENIYCRDSFPQVVEEDINSDCVEFLLATAENNAMIRYEQYLDSIKRDLKMRYMNKCLQAKESFIGEFAYTQHHFTLYYYDQSNNLLQTVPPNGVETLDNNEMALMWTYREDQQAHKLNPSGPPPVAPVVSSIIPQWASEYEYNSLNQITHQKMPDQRGPLGKEYTQFYYDDLGRIVASQNPEQALHDQHSYTHYDYLGRVVESGMIEGAGVTLPTRPIVTGDYNGGNLTNSEPIWTNLFGGTRSEIIYTQYDTPYYGDTPPSPSLEFEQTNLRGRVAAAVYYDTQIQYFDKDPDYATHYSYDIHGNVKDLHQQTQRIGNNKIEYKYDLISGNVNEVSYQKGKLDQFTHRYEYDADNRLTEVYTSRDGMIWDNDASYKYYLHGPLARLELGQDSVQGLDYAYTLQGWIKGMNSASLQQDHDIGQDGMLGHANANFGKDEVGYILNYHQTDYEAIYPNATSLRTFESNFNDQDTRPGLYNGNIRSMITSIDQFMPAGIPSAYSYNYDQLNRIKGMNYHQDFDPSLNQWTNFNTNPDYRSSYAYDANGNITSLERDAVDNSGNPLTMDRFTYNYTSNTNQLTHVNDAVNASNYSNDIDDQAPTNYAYDRIGNLTKDEAEYIQNIEWTNQGKIAKVIKDNGDEVSFQYDALGNRIAKVFGDTTLHYVRDATGNVMAYYQDIQTNPLALPNRTLQSLTLYGSNRLGEYQANKNMFQGVILHPDALLREKESVLQRGKLQYELNNHLGNVLATVSERKSNYPIGSQYSGQLVSIRTASDYMPFGLILKGFSLDYRYGFNSQELELNLSSSNEFYTANYWQYNTRIAKRWNLDPKPNQSIGLYSVLSLNPIGFNDIEGDTVKYAGFQERIQVGLAKLGSKAFRKEFQALKKSQDIFMYNNTGSNSNGQNGGVTLEQSFPSYNVFSINYSTKDPGQRIPIGKGKLHSIFEETYHATDYLMTKKRQPGRSGIMIINQNIPLKPALGWDNNSQKITGESLAWQFAAQNDFTSKMSGNVWTFEGGVREKAHVGRTTMYKIKHAKTLTEISQLLFSTHRVSYTIPAIPNFKSKQFKVKLY